MLSPTPRCLRSLFVPVGCFALLTALTGPVQSEEKDAAKPAQPLPAVTYVEATKKDVTPSSEFVGRVEAVQKVDLMARITGFLDKQDFQDGQVVKEGELLFVIEQEPFAASVKQAEANLAAAKAQALNATTSLKRAEILVERKTVSQATADDRLAEKRVADASVLQSEAALEQANITYSYTEIKSPIDGRIGRTNIKPGNLVSPEAGVLATVVKQDPVYVTFNVTERTVLDFRRRVAEMGSTEDNARATLQMKLRLSDGEIYGEVGKLDFTDVQVNPTTDTIVIRGEFANPNGLLVDQQCVVVIVETADPEQRLVIPRSALGLDQRGQFVLMVNAENKIEERVVQTGKAFGRDIGVTSGLEPGDRVVIQGGMKVRPGMQVNPVAAEKQGT
jgi:membrane fusion protein (multidrug efflux system)